MFIRIVKESFLKKRGRKMAAIGAVALGAAVATAMLAVALGVGDKVNRELRSYGANIEALPQQRGRSVSNEGVEFKTASTQTYLKESDIPRLRSIFWTNNILSFAPFVTVRVVVPGEGSGPGAPGGTTRVPINEVDLIGTWFDHNVVGDDGKSFNTGVQKLATWWKVTGAWPGDGECLAGVNLAARLKIKAGDTLRLKGPDGAESSIRISGIVTTGAEEDDSLIADLAVAQKLKGIPGQVDRVEISALTNPEDDFARRDPATLSPADQERWSCTPYPRSIAADVQRALVGSDAQPVLRISQTEGALLSRVNLLFLLVTIAALAAAILGVASTMMTTVLERKPEIGLLKAIGASNVSVSALFLAEAALVGLAGGLVGLAVGYGLAQLIAHTIFGSGVGMSGVLAPLVLAISMVVAFAGSALPLRTALKFEPSIVLRG